jgi:hypothetical protein
VAVGQNLLPGSKIESFYFFPVAHWLDFDVSQGIRRIKKLHFRVLEFEVSSNHKFDQK